jgi:N-acetylmuramoyl-L-alanine amidase
MRGRFLLAAILGIWLMGAVGEGMAAPRLLGVRKSSGPESTRVVLDLEAPPAYEIQSAASSPILTIYLQKMTLPQGALEILVEDRVVRKVRVDPAEKDGAKVVFFLYQPTRWKVFALTPEGDKPDRLVIDIFRPAGEMGERVEKPESKPPIVEKEKVEKPASKPPGPATPEPKIPPPKVEEPPPAVTPEEPREKGGSPAKGIARLLEIRHWSAPDHTRVVADLEGAPGYEILFQADPLVFTLQLRGILLPKGSQEILVGDPVIRKMKVEPEGRNEAKLSLFLIKPGRLDVFLLKPFEDKPDRLVIDVSRPDLEEKEKEQRQFTRELKAKKKRIVVIDPGHGGDDPGAIGPRKTLEKDIVLALAQNLQKTLDATGEIRAFLSLKGASDKATQVLAQKENASDMVGGTSLAPVQKDLDTILLDLEQTHAINESLQLGGLALNELGRINHIQFSQPRQAGFAVLKSPEFPSILVETAYITHPTEEMLLRKKNFQDRLCQAITAAVKRYIPILSAKEAIPTGDSWGKPSKKKGG